MLVLPPKSRELFLIIACDIQTGLCSTTSSRGTSCIHSRACTIKHHLIKHSGAPTSSKSRPCLCQLYLFLVHNVPTQLASNLPMNRGACLRNQKSAYGQKSQMTPFPSLKIEVGSTCYLLVFRSQNLGKTQISCAYCAHQVSGHFAQ